MLSLCEYTVGREFLRSDGNRIKLKNYNNKPIEIHFGKWISVKSKCYTRLVISQKIMHFFIYGNRDMKFNWLLEKLNNAIAQIGEFKIMEYILKYIPSELNSRLNSGIRNQYNFFSVSKN